MKLPDIARCPFCGGEGEISTARWSYWVTCDGNIDRALVPCGASGPMVDAKDKYGDMRSYKREAILAWNRVANRANAGRMLGEVMLETGGGA